MGRGSKKKTTAKRVQKRRQDKSQKRARLAKQQRKMAPRPAAASYLVPRVVPRCEGCDQQHHAFDRCSARVVKCNGCDGGIREADLCCLEVTPRCPSCQDQIHRDQLQRLDHVAGDPERPWSRATLLHALRMVEPDINYSWSEEVEYLADEIDQVRSTLHAPDTNYTDSRDSLFVCGLCMCAENAIKPALRLLLERAGWRVHANPDDLDVFLVPADRSETFLVPPIPLTVAGIS